jgi:hypothetical protein
MPAFAGTTRESLRDLSNVVAKIEAPNRSHEKARGWIDPSRRAKIPVAVLKSQIKPSTMAPTKASAT